MLTAAHLQIHRALVGLAGSARLLAAADSLSAEVRLGLAHLDRVRGNIVEQVADHRKLVELLEAGDIEAASAELDHHLVAAEVSLLAGRGMTASSHESLGRRVVANACALAVAAWLFSGITVSTAAAKVSRVLTLVVVALIFGLVNEFVRPVVALLAIPLYLLTLGLMYFVVNALMLGITSWVAGLLDIGFHVEGFWTAVFGAIVIAIVSWVVGMALAHVD